MPNKQQQLIELVKDKKASEGMAQEIIHQMAQNEGMTLQDATGIADSTLEELYSLAYTYYSQGKYNESLALFNFLSMTAPKVFKYIYGLASTFHQMGAYEDAIAGFYIALNIDSDNPMPAYYITDSLLKKKRYEEAAAFAEITTLLCEEETQYAEVKERCKLIHKNLEHKLKG